VPTCLGAELSRHFGTSAEVSSGHSALVLKCLGTEVSIGSEVAGYPSTHGVALLMVALCNRADHYIFAL